MSGKKEKRVEKRKASGKNKSEWIKEKRVEIIKASGKKKSE